MKYFLSLAILLLFKVSYSQEKKNIAGMVVNTEGKPLAKVIIITSESKKSLVSNDKGYFHIVGVIKGETLTFNMIGYTSQSIVIGDSSTIKVQLVANIQSLEDVIVVGYGQVKRKDMTGSVGTANIQDMSKAPVTSFEDALAGRVAGVQVSIGDGQPGSMSNIVIRGGNSITQSNAPLYVIDGFPIEDPDNNNINPDVIESIEILKDASSTAIYGARGANGVIIVTTKQGKAGKPVVSYSNWLGSQKTRKTIPVMSSYDFVKYQTELLPGVAEQLYFVDGKTLDSYKDIKGVNWQDQVLRDALMQNHNISVRGGTTATKYSLSG